MINHNYQSDVQKQFVHLMAQSCSVGVGENTPRL